MAAGIGKRIIVVGASGAGKSTLAERLAGRLGVPCIELDALHWEPNWREAEPDVFRERIRREIAAPAWVMAGNYLKQQQEVSWPAADTVVWLDLKLRTVLHRCIVRSWRRYRSRELLWGTNHEVFWEHFILWNPDRSLIAYNLRRYHARRREFEAAMVDPRWSHISFVRLRSDAEVDRWLTGVFQ